MRVLGLLVITLSLAFLYLGYKDVLGQEERNLCMMTYMHPNYLNVSPKLDTPYKLFRYVEGGVSPTN